MHYLRPHLVDGARFKFDAPSAAGGHADVQRGHVHGCREERADAAVRPLAVVPQGIDVVRLEQHVTRCKNKILCIPKGARIILSSFGVRGTVNVWMVNILSSKWGDKDDLVRWPLP